MPAAVQVEHARRTRRQMQRTSVYNGERVPVLSRRLRQTLELLLEGYSEREIARELGLSPHTVHGYCREVFRNFSVPTRPRLMALWTARDAHGKPLPAPQIRSAPASPHA
jgi:DNA-binding CsgD family transcriptional regulator